VARKVYVTGAQKAAARTIMKRDAAKGRASRSAVTKIANAKASSIGRHNSTGHFNPKPSPTDGQPK
jgi:hypothetical protein